VCDKRIKGHKIAVENRRSKCFRSKNNAVSGLYTSGRGWSQDRHGGCGKDLSGWVTEWGQRLPQPLRLSQAQPQQDARHRSEQQNTQASVQRSTTQEKKEPTNREEQNNRHPKTSIRSGNRRAITVSVHMDVAIFYPFHLQQSPIPGCFIYVSNT